MNGRDRRITKPVVTVTATVTVMVAVALYASWLSGVRSFSTTAWVGIAVPAGLLLAVALPPIRRRRRDDDRRTTVRHSLPLLLLFVVAVGVEAAGLALGGRSSTVPTLSTVVDHALAWRATRALLVVLWLGVGFGPALLRLRRPRSPVHADGPPGGLS